jgi:hypothetical protein
MVGLSVDWEIKLLVMAAVYAVAKLLEGNIVFFYFSRAFFALGHIVLVGFALSAIRLIEIGRDSDSEKKASKNNCHVFIRSTLIKFIVIIGLHLRTQLTQPMYISVFLGFFALLENYHMYRVVYGKIPKLIDFLFF